ncbi:unnamed protein product [Zymoseptoria tritici ST99CH_1A5]|uniref:Uncharacterized protein n=1 Tax=Zymoseptoria tritici ST99CH_1A5 TaxID=1276529 RepID=A0A1Y6LPT8_ZYMTR|nr:unnamed protein product [Zymoseptoria tritici ST99CH_1A5]
MAPTEASAARKPSNRMTAEIADYNGVPRSTQEHGTFKWTNRSWYAIEDNTPCDYLVKYETRGVARGMIRFARLEARTNAPISVGELAVRVAALQEAHDATTVSGLVQAKMRAKVWYPWRKELIARGYGKWVSQLFFAKMDDEDGEDIGVGRGPEKDEESEGDGDEEPGEEMDLDEESLEHAPENYDRASHNQTSDEHPMQFEESNGAGAGEEMAMDKQQLDKAPGKSYEDVRIEASGAQKMQRDTNNGFGEEMPANEEQLNEPINSNSTLSIEASDEEQVQAAVNLDVEASEEMDVDEELAEEALGAFNRVTSVEASITQQTQVEGDNVVETGEDMDLDLEQVFDEEGHPITDDSTNLADLRLLFPNGNW